MIRIDKVTKAYGKTVVVDAVTLDLPQKGLTSIIGPNGAGKSTLLSMMSRLMAMDSGTITVNGLDVTTTPGDVLARKLAILRQDNAMTSRLTVRELVAFGRYPHSKGRPTAADRDHVERALDHLELAPLADRFLDELSGGQRQRAFVSMVLCQDTDYVLLDEPLNNLDMKQAVSMMRLLRRAVDEFGKTIVLVLHDINFASSYSDHIVAMRDGRLVQQGSPAALMRPEVLAEIYDLDFAVMAVEDKPIGLYYRGNVRGLIQS
ncbi:iron ABC transporter ATP-binding protein [Mesorhizobium loti]|nr:ABC transporter ATP-binding protein [Mesorhizobium loti]PLP56318.1 iron ABC transporter ATP-binding protein [Mesorhizobium loti]